MHIDTSTRASAAVALLAAFLASAPLEARILEITDTAANESGVITNIRVSAEASASREAVAIAWGAQDGGASLAGWTNLTCVGHIDAGATQMDIAVPPSIRAYFGTSAMAMRVFTLAGTETAPGSDQYVGFSHDDPCPDLIAAWDGIDNAGPCVGHSYTTNTWKDITGHGNDFFFSSGLGNNVWLDNGMRFAGKPAYALAGNPAITNIATMEIIYQPDASEVNSVVFMPYKIPARTAYVFIKNKNIALYDSVCVKADGSRPQYAAAVYNALLTSTFDGALYSNGVAVATTPSGDYYNQQGAPTAQTAWLGGRGTGYTAKGRLFALRIYNRRLSADEIAWNYAVDAARYGLDGGLGSFAVSNPVATGSTRTLSASEMSLSVTASAFPAQGGAIAVSNPSPSVGESVTLQFTPSRGFSFVFWQGLPAGADTTANPVTITVNEPCAATAVTTADYLVASDGDDANDGVTAPFATFDHVAELAIAGGSVTFGPGDFTATRGFVVPADFAVRGAGAGATRIKASGNGFLAFSLAAPNSRLEGVTVDGFNLNGSPIWNGSGISMTDGVVADCVVTNCTDGGRLRSGAGIWISGGLVTNTVVAGCSLSPCGGARLGAGIYMKGGLVVDCDVFDNTTGDWNDNDRGEGVFLDGGTLLRCKVHGNSGRNDQKVSAGVYVNNASARVEACDIHGNMPLGVYMTAGTVANCLVHGNGNETGIASGVCQEGGTLVNNTMTANVSTNGATGPGLFMTRGTSVNNIVWGNGLGWTPLTASAHVTGGTFNTNLVDVSVGRGTGNIADSPHFKAAGDWRTTVRSPAVNAGDNAAAASLGLATDFAGNPRVLPAAAHGRVDLGCLEATGLPPLFLKVR